MSTCSEIITSVQEIFGDTREVAFTRLQCLRWLSEGQQFIARDTECYSSTISYNVTTVGPDYTGHALPVSPIFMREATIEWKGVPLTRYTREDINSFSAKLGDTTSDDPSHYFIFSGRLFLWPYPATPTSTTPVKLWYYAIPDPLITESSDIVIPAALHNDLVDYCLARARERNEDPEQSGRSMQLFESKLAQSREIIFNPHGESYPVIRDDPGDWY